MEVNEFTIKLKTRGRNDWIYIVPLGDLHLGNAGCDLDKFQRQVRYIRDKPNCYWIGMGDYLDCINYTDKRFDPAILPEFLREHLDNLIPTQLAMFVKLIKPIVHKCLGMHRGNHEEKIRLKYHYNVMDNLNAAFDNTIKMLQDTAITRLRLIYHNHKETGIYEIFSTHGCAGGRKNGSKLNRLEDMIGYFDADIYLMGHSHVKTTSSRSVLYLDSKKRIKHKKRVMAVTGCFLNGYTEGMSSYVEKWGFPPCSTGCVKLMLKCPRGGKDIHISE